MVLSNTVSRGGGAGSLSLEKLWCVSLSRS